MTSGASATAILLRSEAQRRRKVYALLFGVFFATTTGLSILLGAVDGIEGAVGAELHDTLSADLRLTQVHPERLADGTIFENASATAAAVTNTVPGALAAPRLEFDAILLHTDRYEDFENAIVEGVDPQRDAQVTGSASLIVEGHFVDAEDVWDNGTPYPQAVIGRELLDSMNISVYDGQHVRPANVLNITAGRSIENDTLRPVVREAVVVGVFRTGFEPLDRGVVFVHLETARELLRVQTQRDAANLVLVKSAQPDAVARAATSVGLESVAAKPFREQYLRAVVLPVRAFAGLVTVVVLLLSAGWVTHVVVDAVLTDRRRLAVLRALGLPTRLLVAPIALALLVAALAGVAFGLAVGWLAARALRLGGVRVPGAEHLDFVATLSPLGMLLLSFAVLLTAVVASGAAAWALRRIPVTEALRN